MSPSLGADGLRAVLDRLVVARINDLQRGADFVRERAADLRRRAAELDALAESMDLQVSELRDAAVEHATEAAARSSDAAGGGR